MKVLRRVTFDPLSKMNHKLKLTKKDKAVIDKVKKTVKKLEDKQEALIVKLTKKLGYKYESENFETIWDYIHNDTSWTIEWTNEKE